MSSSYLQKELNEVKSELDRVKNKPATIINNNNINKGTINRGPVYNFLTKPGEENINVLSETEIEYIMEQEMNCLITLVELVNFNEKHPENHSFCNTALNDKYISTMNTETMTIEKQRKKDFFDQTLSNGIRNMKLLYDKMGAKKTPKALKYKETIDNLTKFVLINHKGKKTYVELMNILTFNKIWKQRLVNIGSLSYEDCINYSLTGVMARSVGLKRDLRLATGNAYSGYDEISMRSYCAHNGDSYDRFLIRMFEMAESLNIVSTVCGQLSKNYFKYSNYNYTPLVLNKTFYKSTKSSYSSMEDLIHSFLFWHTGYIINQSTTVSYIESPKGEFGVILTSDRTSKPSRCKIRSPSYFNLQALPKLARGHYLGDLAALIGTIDIVFGEVDR